MTHSETVEITGPPDRHGILSRVLDDIREYGGDYQVDQFDVGHETDDPSYAAITCPPSDDETLQRLLMRLQTHGVNQVDPGEAERRAWPSATASSPTASTRPPTSRPRCGSTATGSTVENPEMDCGLIVERRGAGLASAPCRWPTSQPGMQVVCGAAGVRVTVPVADARPTATSSSWSPTSPARSRRPCWCARSPTACARPRRPARRCSGSAAPASCTPAPRRRWWRWSRRGTSTCCSPATRWPPTTSSPSLYGTSLGVDLAQGRGVEHGHEHHIRAINTIRKAGSIGAAVEQGVLTGGIMHALVTHGKEFVLVGSVRDDGPLPDVYTDVIEGQRAMRAELAGRRLLPDGRDHAALGRDRQHPAGVGPAGLRRHQPGDRHQAGRPRLLAGPRHRHRRRAVPRAARDGARPRPTDAPDPAAVRARSAAPTTPASGPSTAPSQLRQVAVPGADQALRQAARAGSSSRSPAAETPPPITTTSGSKAATRLATPTPSQCATWSNAASRHQVTLVGRRR